MGSRIFIPPFSTMIIELSFITMMYSINLLTVTLLYSVKQISLEDNLFRYNWRITATDARYIISFFLSFFRAYRKVLLPMKRRESYLVVRRHSHLHFIN